MLNRPREENTGPGGGFARIEEAGVTLARIREQLHARMPTSPETVALKLPEGTPVVELTRTTFDDTGAPVEVGTCDLDNPDSPSSTVAMCRITGTLLEYLSLSDSAVLHARPGRTC